MNLAPGFRDARDTWAKEAEDRALRDPVPAIRVLVWGPALKPSDNADHILLQQKREQILRELNEKGLTACTSEELVEAGSELLSDLPLHHLERQHVETADFIVVLLASPGSIAEFTGLLVSRSALRRSIVFRSAGAFHRSYVGDGPLKNAEALQVVHTYTDEELRSCRVASTAVDYALDTAESLRGSEP